MIVGVDIGSTAAAGPREDMVTGPLTRAAAEGQTSLGFDLATATKMLQSGVWYRMLDDRPPTVSHRQTVSRARRWPRSGRRTGRIRGVNTP